MQAGNASFDDFTNVDGFVDCSTHSSQHNRALRLLALFQSNADTVYRSLKRENHRAGRQSIVAFVSTQTHSVHSPLRIQSAARCGTHFSCEKVHGVRNVVSGTSLGCCNHTDFIVLDGILIHLLLGHPLVLVHIEKSWKRSGHREIKMGNNQSASPDVVLQVQTKCLQDQWAIAASARRAGDIGPICSPT